MVDGIRVKCPTLGQAELSDISPELIERVEIIRGPQSTLYGADAIGGVVNIITKKGKGPFSARVEQEVGNYNTYVSRARVSGATGPFDYALGVFHLESGGQSENDDSRQTAVNLRLGLTLPYDSGVTFTLRWNETNTGLPVKFVTVPLDRKSTRLNSSHVSISYAVFCLKKKKKNKAYITIINDRETTIYKKVSSYD